LLIWALSNAAHLCVLGVLCVDSEPLLKAPKRI
jgi:hypothetical protein